MTTNRTASVSEDKDKGIVKQDQFNDLNERLGGHYDEIISLKTIMDNLKKSFEEYKIQNKQQQLTLEQVTFFKADNLDLWQDIIQRKDIPGLQRLVERKMDATGVSFVSMAHELKDSQITELRKQGGIFTIKELEDATQHLLSNLTKQQPKKRVMRRLHDGIHYMLQLWRQGKLPSEINTDLLISSISELLPLFAAEGLPEKLNKWLTDRLQEIQMEEYEKWIKIIKENKESKSMPSNSVADDELTATDLTDLVEDRIWGQWKTGVAETKTNTVYNSIFANQLGNNVCDIVVTRLRQGKLPDEIIKSLWENISDIIMNQLNGIATPKIDDDLEALLVKRYQEILPTTEAVHDTDKYYRLALNEIYQSWKDDKLDPVISKIIQQIVKSYISNNLKLTGDLRSEIDREAVKLLLKQFHANKLREVLNAEIKRISKNIQITKKAKEAEKTEAIKRMIIAWQQGKFDQDESHFLFQATTQSWQVLIQRLDEALNPHIQIGKLKEQVSLLEQQVQQLQGKLPGLNRPPLSRSGSTTEGRASQGTAFFASAASTTTTSVSHLDTEENKTTAGNKA